MNRERSTRGSNAKKYHYQIESSFKNADRPLKEIYDYNFTYQTELLRTKFVQNLQDGDFFIATFQSHRIYFRKKSKALISEQPHNKFWPRLEEAIFVEIFDEVPENFAHCTPIKSFFNEQGQVQFCFQKRQN